MYIFLKYLYIKYLYLKYIYLEYYFTGIVKESVIELNGGTLRCDILKRPFFQL